MGYVTAGLLSGLGQGLNDAGKTLEKRREDALQWAAQLNLASAKADADARLQASQDDRSDARLKYSETNANLRTAATIEGEGGRQTAQQAFIAAQEQKKYEQQQNLARLQADLSAHNITLRAKTEHDLNSGNVIGQDWGPVNPDTGLAELILYTRDGKTKHTGDMVAAPESRNNRGHLQNGPGVASAAGSPFGTPGAGVGPTTSGATAAPEKIYTSADVIASARSQGISTTEAERRIKALGYRKGP